MPEKTYDQGSEKAKNTQAEITAAFKLIEGLYLDGLISKVVLENIRKEYFKKLTPMP